MRLQRVTSQRVILSSPWSLFLSLSLALAVLLPAAVPASACKGKTVLFRDGFKALDPGWGLFDPNTVAIGDGWLKLSPLPQRFANIHYRGVPYDQADVCVDAVLGPTGVPEGFGGLIFAQEDFVGHHMFWISPKSKTAGIRQFSLSTNSWTQPVPPKLAQFNFDAGARNTVRVTVKGAQIATYINDRPFAPVTIKAPQIGGFFGLTAARLDANPAMWSFANFTITDLP